MDKNENDYEKENDPIVLVLFLVLADLMTSWDCDRGRSRSQPSHRLQAGSYLLGRSALAGGDSAKTFRVIRGKD